MDRGIVGEEGAGAVAVVEIEIDDEHRRRESPLPQLADGDRHVIPQAEALAAVGVGVVETAA